MIWPRADDADLDAILRVPSRETIKTIKSFTRVQVIESALPVDLEGVFIKRDIHWPPPNILLRRGILDHALVFLGDRPVFTPE
jgi:hypothetical protein